MSDNISGSMSEVGQAEVLVSDERSLEKLNTYKIKLDEASLTCRIPCKGKSYVVVTFEE